MERRHETSLISSFSSRPCAETNLHETSIFASESFHLIDWGRRAPQPCWFPNFHTWIFEADPVGHEGNEEGGDRLCSNLTCGGCHYQSFIVVSLTMKLRFMLCCVTSCIISTSRLPFGFVRCSKSASCWLLVVVSSSTCSKKGCPLILSNLIIF